MKVIEYNKVNLRDILYLDEDAEEGVKMLYDMDVIRVPINIQQILETIWGTILGDSANRMSPRDPSCPWLGWVLKSRKNYEEIWNYGMDIIEEHYFRFGSRNMHPYCHGSQEGFKRLNCVPSKLPNTMETPKPLSYEDAREIYRAEDGHYTNRSRPEWLK